MREWKFNATSTGTYLDPVFTFLLTGQYCRDNAVIDDFTSVVNRHAAWVKQ